MCGNTAYRAIEPLKITAREISSPRQPYVDALSLKDVHLGLENGVYCQETQV